MFSFPPTLDIRGNKHPTAPNFTLDDLTSNTTARELHNSLGLTPPEPFSSDIVTSLTRVSHPSHLASPLKMGDLIPSDLDMALPKAEPTMLKDVIGGFKDDLLQYIGSDITKETIDRDSSNISEDDEDENHQLAWNEPSKPRKISQKKRSEIAGFDTWLEEHREQVSKETAERMSGTYDDNSVNYLVKGMEGHRIITSPRDYQVELFERAKQMNTIAVLDTGSGKTLIAALLLQWVIDHELEDRAAGLQKRISFFLVDKVALVFQQHAVLDCNLDHPVEKFCGTTLNRGWKTKAFWDSVVNDNMVVVCTAEILRQCLQHAYIRLDQINLLIFDEAHHAKKEHPYAKIILDFYIHEENKARRPRIFGMTASPVDAKTNVTVAATALEEILHSKIATASDPTVLQRTVSKPKAEILQTYNRLSSPHNTELTLRLMGPLGSNKAFRKLFQFSRDATSQLGPWCADRVWQKVFLEEGEQLMRLEARGERDFAQDTALGVISKEYQSVVHIARPLVCAHSFESVRPTVEHLSPKVMSLLNCLSAHFSKSEDTKCIIFVQMRLTALMLMDLLQQPNIRIKNVKVGTLIGSGNGGREDGFSGNSFRSQILTIMKFKKGELNCLISTSVGEEGIDIPDCNLIIRFDLYTTMIQYIQSRGRARHENSTYIHMLEIGNGEHRRRLYQNTYNEAVLREFCSALPEDRKLEGYDSNMDYYLKQAKNKRQYIVKSTGAKLNFKQSLVTLATFVSSLPHADEVNLVPEYVMSATDEGYVCEVMLPLTSPIRSVTGHYFPSKQAAKCSAAYEMCLELIRNKYLDEHLRPIFTKQLPAMANARLNISSKKKDQYGMRPKPELWRNLGEPLLLYATVMILSKPESMDKPSRPLILLTSSPMPMVSSFPLFFGKGRSSAVELIGISIPIEPTKGDLNTFAKFTLRIFQDVFSKWYKATVADLPYFIVPSKENHHYDFSTCSHPSKIIDWKATQYVQSTERVTFDGNEPDDFFVDKYVTDPYDGSRKFYLRKVRRDLKQQDSIPEGIKVPTNRAWNDVPHDIRNYSLRMWSNSRNRFQWQEHQPVVEADLVPLRRNLLDERLDAESTMQTCFLVLQPLEISPLPVDVVAMAYNIPAIIYRLESNLVALDACKLVGLDIRPDLAIEAFTKDSDNTDEHDQEPLNFQAGMGKNYERLEFLGDSFLKMATTISLYTLIPDKNEFDYHVERMCLICNKNLFNNALDLNLQEYIRSKAFSRRTWYPDNLELIKGKKTEEKKNKNTHILADKSIADVCEALIGAAYMTGRESNDFDMAVQAVTVVVNHKNHRMKSWSEYYAAYEKPNWQTANASASQLALAKKIKEKMGYDFKYPRLLRCAFRHPSYPRHYESLPSYQRLEFLGDALLDMVIVDYLYQKYPTKDPQWLTEHKMAIVSNQFLGCLAVSLGFHKHMLSFSSTLQKQVMEYVTVIVEAKEQAEEEAQRTKEGFAWDYWVNVNHPPKCLADLVEAYVGAVFVDSQYDYGQVQAFFDTHVLPYFRDMSIYDTFANKHPVTFCSNLLGQTFHCNGWGVQIQEVQVTEGEGFITGATKVVAGFLVHGQVVGHGVSESGRYAKIYAAKEALKKLQSMTVSEFRDEFKCNCIPEEAATDDVLEHATAV